MQDPITRFKTGQLKSDTIKLRKVALKELLAINTKTDSFAGTFPNIYFTFSINYTMPSF